MEDSRRREGALADHRTAYWVWPEMADSLKAAVVEARMREVRFAEDGLADIREREHRSPLARAVVLWLAQDLADELDSYTC